MSSVESFFRDTPPPKDFDDISAKMEAFLKANRGKRVAVVTSGGTTVPLEKKTVRYLDNFSGGGRGSKSAEEFLRAGYAVIFIARENSLLPYSRYFRYHPKGDYIDLFDFDEATGGLTTVIRDEETAISLVREYQDVLAEGRLMKVLYRTVHDYMHLLRLSSELLQPSAGKLGVMYCAAAVSDFYVPFTKLREHKIQSSEHTEGLQLKLWPVPKLLGTMKKEWCPDVYVVTFKLETDVEILDYKMGKSMASYGQQLVIGNLLSSYKDRVKFCSQSGEAFDIVRALEADNIEPAMIAAVDRLHQEYVRS